MRMTSGKKTDPAVLVVVLLTILLILAAVGLRLWANDQRLSVPNLKAMTVAPDGRVFLVLGNSLYIESADGESLEVKPLSEWGVEDFHGELAVLRDNSVLLARGRKFAARSQAAGDAAGRASTFVHRSEPLMRCSLQSNTCSILDGGADVGRGFSLAADETNGRLYVADPGRHRLLQLSMQGEQLAQSRDGWKYPNSIRLLREDRVAFVDTNNFRYLEMAVDEAGFGRVVHEQGIQGWPDIVPLMRYPSEVLKDVNGTLWMLIADATMADAYLYHAPPDGTPRRVNLPGDADPLELAEIDGSILVTDQQYFRIRRFDLAGNEQEDFGSPQLRGQLREHAEQHALYEAIFNYSLVAVLMIAIPALGAGIKLQKNADRRHAAQASGSQDEEVLADEDLQMSGFSLPTQHAQLRGEFVFLRKFSVLGTRADSVVTFFTVMALIVPLLMILHFKFMFAEQKGEQFDLLADTELLLMILVTSLFLLLGWFSMMYERLVVSGNGIRYQSLFPGLLARWNGVLPSWELRWSEIESLRLRRAGKGNHPLKWQYEIIAKTGRKRRIHPLSWRLAGEPEAGLTVATVLRRKPEAIHAVIHRTWLFRLLGSRRKQATAD